MPSNFAAVTTSLGKGRDVGARHQALGSGAIRSGEERKEMGKEGSRDRLGEAGDGIGEAGHSGSGQGEGRSERGGWVKKGERGGQIKYR